MPNPNANVVQFPRQPRNGEPLGSLADVSANLVPTKVGDKGANVSALQATLTSWGLNTGAIDGDYGPKTATAVKALQAILHLPSTGDFDTATANAVATDLSMANSYLKTLVKAPPSTTYGAPKAGTPVVAAPGAPLAVATAHTKASPWLWIGLGLSGLAGLAFIIKAFSGGSPAAQPAAPAAPTPGVAGAEFFDEVDAEFEEAPKPKRKRKSRAKKQKALPAEIEDAEIIEDDEDEYEGYAQDLPDDYEMEDPILYEARGEEEESEL